MLRVELIRPVPELLAERAARLGDKVAFCDDRSSVSYARLAERTRCLAGNLAGVGVARGDRVLIYLENSVETAECYLATVRAGAVGVCVNAAGALPEIGYLLADSDPRVIITDQPHLESALALVAERADADGDPGGDSTRHGAGVTILLTGAIADVPASPGLLRYEELATTEPAAPPPDDLGLDEVAWMLYTSGTTGRPKGVLLTQRSCLWVVAACWAPIVGLREDDVVLSPLPLFHSYALDLCVLAVLAVGATERILPRFTTQRVLELLAAGPYSVLPGVPTMFQYLLHGAADAGDAGRFRSRALRLALSAGAILPASVNVAFEEVFGVQLLDGYGITETSTMVTMNWPTGGRVFGSCGLPVPGVAVRLVDPVTGRDVPAGAEGELWVSGPNVMRGYYNLPEATDQALQDGWYRTGDLGRRDPNGFLTISGRTKELIIRGGENIYPAEVEAVLLKAAGVADAAVVGQEHPDLGEVPVAFVVPVDPGTLDEQELLAACGRELSKFKVPARFIEIDAIPRTGSGKVMRYRLKERLP